MKKYQKGIVLSWEIPKEEKHFHMTILQDKILLKKQGQDMVFELEKTTKSTMNTVYGNINMYITTNKMKVLKQGEKIKKIVLEYQIELENSTAYQNQLELIIK